MREWIFLFDITSLLLSVAAQVVTWALYKKTGNQRVFHYLMSNLFVSLIVAVLTWDLYCSITGRVTALRSLLWGTIDFWICGLCCFVPRLARPKKMTPWVRGVERGFCAAAVLAAAGLAAYYALYRWPLRYMPLYFSIYALLSLALVYFPVNVLVNRRSYLADPALRHYQKALDVVSVTSLALLPALVLVDFLGWLLPSISNLMDKNFSVLPLCLVVMSLAIAVACVRDILEPGAVRGMDAIDLSFIRKYNLTPREGEIVPLVLQCLSYRQIAERLFISPGTVRTHLIHIYQKTGVEGRLALSRLVQNEYGSTP